MLRNTRLKRDDRIPNSLGQHRDLGEMRSYSTDEKHNGKNGGGEIILNLIFATSNSKLHRVYLLWSVSENQWPVRSGPSQ